MKLNQSRGNCDPSQSCCSVFWLNSLLCVVCYMHWLYFCWYFSFFGYDVASLFSTYLFEFPSRIFRLSFWSPPSIITSPTETDHRICTRMSNTKGTTCKWDAWTDYSSRAHKFFLSFCWNSFCLTLVFYEVFCWFNLWSIWGFIWCGIVSFSTTNEF